MTRVSTRKQRGTRLNKRCIKGKSKGIERRGKREILGGRKM